MRATVEKRRRHVTGVRLHEPAPEQFLGGPDDEREARHELFLRSEGTQCVDVADLLTTARHHLPRDRISRAEEAVETSGRAEPEGHLTRSDARATRVAVGGERERAEGEPCCGHAIPEALARAAEGQAERGERGGDAERKEPQRSRGSAPRPPINASRAPRGPARRLEGSRTRRGAGRSRGRSSRSRAAARSRPAPTSGSDGRAAAARAWRGASTSAGARTRRRPTARDRPRPRAPRTAR